MRERNQKQLCYLSWRTLFAMTLIMLTIGGYGTEAGYYGTISRHVSNYLSRHPDVYSRAFIIRGGFSDDEEYEEDGEEFEDENEEEKNEDQVEETEEGGNAVLNISKRVVIVIGKATIATASALKRAVQAAFQVDDDVQEGEEAKEPSAVSKFIKLVKRMWRAALNPSDSDRTNRIKQSSKSVRKDGNEEKDEKEAKKPDLADFGGFLATKYGVKVDRDVDTSAQVLGGTFGDALREAHSQARLLVVFIPASKPGRGKKSVPDQRAIQSLLSPQVSEAAKKRARKKADFGSYVLWGAKVGSPEAVTAIKRLRAKHTGSKGGKRPMLLVAYPAQVESSGRPKLVPRLLAQHHCSPPPSSESMAAWLNALRKRHSKQYSRMQHDLKEVQLLKERQEGYISSIVSDRQREEQEKKDEEERLAKEEAEKERLAELERRREELKVSLPDEPGKDAKNVMTIALRFADGRTGQRRFDADTQIDMLFNWVDALYEMERETVILTTMNGQKSFSWEDTDVTLKETGLGRMTGLRVSQKETEAESEEDQSSQEASQ